MRAITGSIVQIKEFLTKAKNEKNGVFVNVGGGAVNFAALDSSLTAYTKASAAYNAVYDIPASLIGQGTKNQVQTQLMNNATSELLSVMVATAKIVQPFVPEIENAVTFASDLQSVLQPFKNSTDRSIGGAIVSNKKTYDVQSNLLTGAIINKSVAIRDYAAIVGQNNIR